MIRYDCLSLLAPRITDQLVVTSLSGQKIEWASLSQHPGNLLVGTMGTALGVGIGLAIGLAIGLPERKVIVLESDGSVLLSLFNLATLANLGPKNLIVFVFDNQVYSGTRISEPTATAGKTDLTMMARGAGIEQATTVRDLAAFAREMDAALNGAEMKFIVCKIEESVGHREITRTDLDPLENKYQFVRYLERTEGRPIFRGRG
jgi:sulfopyruvate decarboxylase subunit beta